LQLAKPYRQLIRQRIIDAIDRLDVTRYRQEPAYVIALLGRLDGFIVNDSTGFIEIKSTIVDDRGSNSAEFRYGADFAITLSAKISNQKVQKATLGQAKRGNIYRDHKNLIKQCQKMGRVTTEYLVLETPEEATSEPLIYLKDNRASNLRFRKPMTLDTYILDEFLLCNHGDQRSEIVENVQDSQLNTLKILVQQNNES
jgi:hypothetical protein